MIHFDSLVISVPAYQLGESVFLGSVFDARELKKLTLPADLQLAVELILGAYTGKNAPLLCVVRPEMFTHGRSLEWLREKIGAATDHLCLSDGTTVKLIPGMRNHLFTCGLQSNQRLAGFKRLMRRAPELLQQFDTQVNSFHSLVTQGVAVEPVPLSVMLSAPLPAKLVWFYALYSNPHSVEESVNYMLSWGELDEKKLSDFERIIYVPLTEVASSDVAFQRAVCELITKTYFDGKSCLILRLPAPGADLRVRMSMAIAGILSASTHFPRARAANVFLVADDVSEQTLMPLASRITWMMHQTVDYWRYTKPMYAAAAHISVFPDRWRLRSYDAAKKLLADSFGKIPELIAPARSAEDASVFEFLQ